MRKKKIPLDIEQAVSQPRNGTLNALAFHGTNERAVE
jgi:hypothetical protein